MKTILLVLADGFEEVEALTPADLLRRAGFSVRLAGLSSGVVKGSHGISVVADLLLDEWDGKFDALILPGGQPGSDNLAASGTVRTLIETAQNQKALIGAICAAPGVVLGSQGFLKGRRFTGFPGTETLGVGAQFVKEPVVTDGNFITSRGLGTASAFSLAIIEYFLGAEKAHEIGRKTMILP